MRSLLGQVQFPLVLGEGDVDLIQQQVLDDVRPLLGQKADRLLVRDPGPGPEDVADQLRRRVPLALVDDPALSPGGVAAGSVAFVTSSTRIPAPARVNAVVSPAIPVPITRTG
jgi:hypothetical protein